MPTARATKKWPASWTRIRTASPRIAAAKLMRGTQLAGAAPVGLDELVEVARGRAVDARERVLDRRGDVEEQPIRPSRNAWTATSFAAL